MAPCIPCTFTCTTCHNSAVTTTSWETRNGMHSSGQLGRYTQWGNSHKTQFCIMWHVSCQHSASHLTLTSMQCAAFKLATAMHHEATGTRSHHPINMHLCQRRTKATKILNTSENAPSSNTLLTIHTASHAPKLRKCNQVKVKIKGHFDASV